jgi:hypothetical protein
MFEFRAQIGDFVHITAFAPDGNQRHDVLIPLLLTMYILIAIISAIGKDFIVELVWSFAFSNSRRGDYTFSSPFLSANNSFLKSPSSANSS